MWIYEVHKVYTHDIILQKFMIVFDITFAYNNFMWQMVN
jgi:hypothetical protein